MRSHCTRSTSHLFGILPSILPVLPNALLFIIPHSQAILHQQNMTDSSPAAGGMAGSDIELSSVLPIGLIVPSKSDVAKTLPFDYNWESKDLRAVSLQRTRQRWAWFSKAEDQDRERGTQLGTLGYLPWEVRQMVFEKLFDNLFHCRYKNMDELYYPWCIKSSPWHDLASLDASASMMLEVKYAYLTTTNFQFNSSLALSTFLGHLTKYEKSLLRYVTIAPWLGDDIKVENEIMRDACAELPSGLISITFTFGDWLFDGTGKAFHKAVDFLELLGKQSRRCWAPRAKISIDHTCCYWELPEWSIPLHEIVSSTFTDLEPWSQDWLDWWASSQKDDPAEEQSSPPNDKIGETKTA